MREPEPMGYYAIRDDKDLPRVMHAVAGRAPAGSIEITREQAEAISQAYRSDRPKAKPPADQAMVVAVIEECKDQIVAVVQEANADRDEAFGALMTRVATLERIIDALGEKADKILEAPE